MQIYKNLTPTFWKTIHKLLKMPHHLKIIKYYINKHIKETLLSKVESTFCTHISPYGQMSTLFNIH